MTESVVELVTTTFGANVAIAVIFGGGYLWGKNIGSSYTIGSLTDNVLLPSLLFTTLAGSSFLTWSRLLQIAWPSLVIALITHVPAILYAALGRRFFSSPTWIAQPTVFNNSLSYPLLLLVTLGHLSSEDNVLGHLRWRTFDTLSEVVERGSVYLVVNFGLTQIARKIITPIVEDISPPQELQVGDDLEEDEGLDAAAIDEEDATERTPLVHRLNRHKPITAIKRLLTSHSVIAVVIGLLVALIKPVQRWLFGISVQNPHGGWIWQSIGWGVSVLGAVYIVLDIVRFAASLREIDSELEDEVPPTLGTVITLSFFRYILVPLITLPTIYGLLKIPSTKFYLQDPAFSFILGISVFGPPTTITHRSKFQSCVLFSTFLTSLILALPISLGIAITGRGVSYDTDFDLVEALKKAGGGGLAGAAAMVVQVLTLMPLRTIMNYQYRYGGTIKGATKTLYEDGGFRRYYAGLAAALFQGPFARFGDTAANAGIIALLASVQWPVLVKTVAASVASACFRMILTPIDTLKTTQQTNGAKGGLKLLKERVKEKGVGCLWYGALATAAATFVGHYPWFGTYNYLQAALPAAHTLVQRLLRQAFIGFAASVVSDTISNSLRVVKTYRQVHEGDVGYMTAAKEIVASEGLLGLFGRGLPTRLLTNGLQGLLFSILWKYFTDLEELKATMSQAAKLHRRRALI